MAAATSTSDPLYIKLQEGVGFAIVTAHISYDCNLCYRRYMCQNKLERHNRGVYSLIEFVYSGANIFQVDTSSRASPGTSDPLDMTLQERIPGYSSYYTRTNSYHISDDYSLCVRQYICRATQAEFGLPDCICESCGFPQVIYTVSVHELFFWLL